MENELAILKKQLRDELGDDLEEDTELMASEPEDDEVPKLELKRTNTSIPTANEILKAAQNEKKVVTYSDIVRKSKLEQCCMCKEYYLEQELYFQSCSCIVCDSCVAEKGASGIYQTICVNCGTEFTD